MPAPTRIANRASLTSSRPSTDKTHPVVVRIAAVFKSTKPSQFTAGRHDPRLFPRVPIRVFPASRERALRILDTFLKSAEARGWKVTDAVEHGDKLTLTILGEQYPVLLKEQARQVEHVPTEKEQRDLKRWAYTSVPAFDYVPTGELSIIIGDGYYPKAQIKDGKLEQLESKLEAFLGRLEEIAEKDKAARQEAARREAERIRLEIERRKREAVESERRALLERRLKGWHDSADIRAFIAAIQDAFQQAGTNPRDDLAEWLAWASDYASQLDPIPILISDMSKE